MGAWCFVDHIGPGEARESAGLDIGPHPHIGLQTVTWLLSGAILHRDSLGSEQVIRPGQLNLMTAGHGVSHSEETTGTYSGELHGVQLWVALPSATRNCEPAFEHHSELPQVEFPNSTGTVLVGAALGGESPARRDTDHVGVDLCLRAGRTVVPLAPDFEHGLVALDGSVTIGTARLEPGHLGYLGLGRDEVALDADMASRVLLVGGVPFEEPLLMWWNYVARTHEELVAAHRDWTDAAPRFGQVASTLARVNTTDRPPAGPRR